MVAAVRGGGHNIAGHAVCNDGLVIDLSLMKALRYYPGELTIQAEAGLTWGEVDRKTQEYGLAVPGGIHTTTGIAGLTLGGGIGYLSRKYGLTIDSLVSAEVVTADGRFVTASKEENSDLFWGLRGGGGNFGIVTSFEYQLHPVGPMVWGGMVLYPLTKAKEVLRFYREFVASAPDELCTFIDFMTPPPSEHLPEQLHNAPTLAVHISYLGRLVDGLKLIKPLRTVVPPVADLIRPMSYVELQSLLDDANPPGYLNYWKSDFLTNLSDEAIDVLIEYASTKPSPRSKIIVVNLLGAVSRVDEDETAFNHRGAPFVLNINSSWSDPLESDRNEQWAADLWYAMHPFSTGGAYINFMTNESRSRVEAAYGQKYERLVALKDKYDPTNFFRLNQNIRPSSRSSDNSG
jgi:FAD/FMN-containing dehydrogenase